MFIQKKSWRVLELNQNKENENQTENNKRKVICLIFSSDFLGDMFVVMLMQQFLDQEGVLFFDSC